MGLVQLVQDWRRKEQLKKDLWEQLKRLPPGRGITLHNPNDPQVARAIIELLKEHAQMIEVLDNGFAITLMHKITMHAGASREAAEMARKDLGLFDAEAMEARGYGKGAALPPRQWRDGVPDDVNTNGPVRIDRLADGRPFGLHEDAGAPQQPKDGE